LSVYVGGVREKLTVDSCQLTGRPAVQRFTELGVRTLSTLREIKRMLGGLINRLSDPTVNLRRRRS